MNDTDKMVKKIRNCRFNCRNMDNEFPEKYATIVAIKCNTQKSKQSYLIIHK